MAALRGRRAGGQDVDVPSVPTMVLGQELLQPWARGVVWDCRDPTTCAPVERSTRDTVLPGARQFDRGGCGEWRRSYRVGGDGHRGAGGGGLGRDAGQQVRAHDRLGVSPSGRGDAGGSGGESSGGGDGAGVDHAPDATPPVRAMSPAAPRYS
eukprot:4822659-Pleurochrysis_carterae.AAC.1